MNITIYALNIENSLCLLYRSGLVNKLRDLAPSNNNYGEREKKIPKNPETMKRRHASLFDWKHSWRHCKLSKVFFKSYENKFMETNKTSLNTYLVSMRN